MIGAIVLLAIYLAMVRYAYISDAYDTAHGFEDPGSDYCRHGASPKAVMKWWWENFRGLLGSP